MFGRTFNLNVTLTLSDDNLKRLSQLLADEVACKVLDSIQDQAAINNGMVLNALEASATSLKRYLKGELNIMSAKSEQRLQQIANNLGVAFTDMAGRINQALEKARQALEEAVKDSDSKADARLAAVLEDEFSTLEEVSGKMVSFLADTPEITTVPPGTTAPDAPILAEIPVSVGGDTAVEVPADAPPSPDTQSGAVTDELANPGSGSGSGQ